MRRNERRKLTFFFPLSQNFKFIFKIKKKNFPGESHPLVRRLLSPKVTGGGHHSVLLFCRLRNSSSRTNEPYFFLGRLGDPRVDWGDAFENFDGDEDQEEEAVLERAASSISSPRRPYPAMFAWKLLDADLAAARGGRGVEALFEAGAPREKKTRGKEEEEESLASSSAG